MLARRWDPTTGGRRTNLLRAVLQPGRSSMEDLSAALERWEDLVRWYERSRDSQGDATLLSEDIKQAALEALVPTELEKHLQLNAARLPRFTDTCEEVRLFIETRLGQRVKEPKVTGRGAGGGGHDPMDVDSFAKGKHGGGKGGGKAKGGNGKQGGKGGGKGGV